MGRLNNLYIVLAIFLLIQSCASVQETYDPKDLSYLYNPSRNVIHPDYRIYNLNDSISELSIKLSPNDLFFSEANSEGIPRAAMVVIYRIYNISQGVVPVDTGFYNMTIDQVKGKRQYTLNIPIEADKGSRYEAEIVVRDLIRNLRVQTHIPFDKTTDINRFNFKVRGHFNHFDIYTPVLKREEFVNLLYPEKEADSLYMYYFDPYTSVPVAPSMLVPETEIDLEPEELLVLPFSDTLPIMLPIEGVYMYSVDSTIMDGYTFMNFGIDFPNMTNPLPMIDPLIYLSSIDKIEEMKGISEDRSLAMDLSYLENQSRNS